MSKLDSRGNMLGMEECEQGTWGTWETWLGCWVYMLGMLVSSPGCQVSSLGCLESMLESNMCGLGYLGNGMGWWVCSMDR